MDAPSCPQCQYALDGLEEADRCPECGIDLAQAFRDDHAGVRATRWFKRWFGVIALAGTVWVMWRLVATNGTARAWLALGAAVVLVVFTLIMGYELGLCRSSEARRPRDWDRSEYTIVLGCWVVLWVGVALLAG
jgi:hypothetical protein